MNKELNKKNLKVILHSLLDAVNQIHPTLDMAQGKHKSFAKNIEELIEKL